MSFFKRDSKSIYFITKNFDKVIDGKSDIVLSPQFYWVKKVALNVRFSYEVKKMAPAIFDGLLPNGNFRYSVLKTDTKEFVILAYDIEQILKELNSLGIDITLIDRIYTLQSEIRGDEVSLVADNLYGIASDDGIAVCLPLKFFDKQPKRDINGLLQKKLSKNYIYSKNYQKTDKNRREANLILWLLVLAVSLLFVNVAKIQKERDALAKQKETIIKKYVLPKTSFEIKSMKTELLATDRKQKQIRESISYLGKFRLMKKESFASIKYKKSDLKFSIYLNGRNREIQFKNYISKKFKAIKTQRVKKKYIIEVVL